MKPNGQGILKIIEEGRFSDWPLPRPSPPLAKRLDRLSVKQTDVPYWTWQGQSSNFSQEFNSLRVASNSVALANEQWPLLKGYTKIHD